MATSYAIYILNFMPNAEDISPAYIFTGTKFTCHKLKDINVLVCPVYVLDPMLQQGRKLPKLQLWSRCRIFVWFSPNYSSDVPLIPERANEHISPQFHVIFDDYFITALSLYPE